MICDRHDPIGPVKTDSRGRSRSLSLFLFGLVTAATLLAAGSGESPAERVARVESGLLPKVQWKGQATERWRLADRMRHYGAVGLSLAVIDDFEIQWSRGWGVLRRGADEPVSANTLFMVGSMSKPIAALLTLNLVDEGLLDLDDPVNRRLVHWQLPQSAAGGDQPVRVRHLLSHGAGIAAFAFPLYAPGEEYPGVLALLDGTADPDIPPVVRIRPPGVRFEYSNAGYAVLELLLTDVAAMDFADLAAQRLFEPLGLQSSSFARRLPEDLAERAAWGHSGEANDPIEGKGWSPPAAVGGFWTTPTDYARLLVGLMRAFRGDGEQIVSPRLAQQMLRPQVDGQGLGVRLRGEGEGLYCLHAGGMPGFVSLFVAFPDTGQGAVVAMNGGAVPLLSEVIRAVASEYDWPGYLPQLEVVDLEPATFARYEGLYRFDRGAALEMVIASRDGKYYRGRSEMVAVSESVFVLPEFSLVVEFLVDADGVVRSFRHGELGVNHAWARRLPSDMPESPHVENGALFGVVRKAVGPWGNLETNLREIDLQRIGGADSKDFEIVLGSRRLNVRRVGEFAALEPGEWGLVQQENGRLILGAGRRNALAELAAAPGTRLEVRPLPADQG